MTGHGRWATRLAMAAAALVALAPSAMAQTVLVRVVDAETSEPLAGAVGHLLSPSGEVLTSRLSDGNGRVLFTGIEGGRYRVRAEMLGRSTQESDEFGVIAGGSVPLVLRLPSRAIELAGVEVTAEAGPCETRPRQEGRLLAEVWEEARKALSAAAVAEQQGIYRYSIVRYEQDLDADGVILDEEQIRRRGYMRTPFESRAVEELTGEGFVGRTAAEWTYYAPDAQALLSDPFLDTHCFRLVAGEPERPGLVGLAFRPTGENEAVPDISGTLWLDRDSVALRWLEYTYENLEPEVRPGDATGRIEFQRLPEGAWIVPEWWIRMPLVEVDVARSDRRRRITGFRRSGGRVQEIVAAGGSDLARGASTGAIEGIVVDSLGMPVRGVRIGSAGSDQSIFTNREGRFNLVGLAEGTYRVRFVDPDLEALGLGPPEITREVVAGVSSRVDFVMPSPADLLRQSCGDEATPGTGLLGGIVRDAETDDPLVGAGVRVRWSQLELNGASTGLIGREAYTELQTTTDGFGVYRFCSVPRRQELRVVSSVDEVDGAPVVLALSDEEEARLHVIRYAPARAGDNVQPDLVQPTDDARPGSTDASEPGSADGLFLKSGRVRDAATNAALGDALVELPELDMRAVTDGDGRVSFESVPEGEHALRVGRLGYHGVEGTLEVPGGREFVVLLEPMSVPENESGAVLGQVTDEHGQGVANADIVVVGQPSARTISNPQGRFRIDGLEPGVLEVRFERLGHTPRTAEFVVQAGRTAELSVVMPTEAIDLEPIEVTILSSVLERNGFYERRLEGFGHHFDREEIARINPELVYDIVRRAPAVRVNDPRSVVGAPSYAFNARRAGLRTQPGTRPPRVPPGDDTCYLSLYVDGMRMNDPDLQQVHPSAVEAVEVYVGANTPIEYRANQCGAILIWTRR